MSRAARLRTITLGLLVVSLWGSSFALTKVALQDLGPISIALYRWSIAAAAFVALLPALGLAVPALKALREDWPRFMLLGMVGISLFYALQNMALRFTSAAHVGILINVCTIFIAILGALLLGERMGRVALVGMAVAFAGATLVSIPAGGIEPQAGQLNGDIITVAAALCAAIYTVYGKRILERHSPLVVTGLSAAFGTIFLLPFAAVEGLTMPTTLATWAALLTLGLGSGALANLWWWQVLQQMDAARAGTFLLVIPVISTVLAVVWLREPLQPTAIAGTGLVLAGVFLTQRSS